MDPITGLIVFLMLVALLGLMVLGLITLLTQLSGGPAREQRQVQSEQRLVQLERRVRALELSLQAIAPALLDPRRAVASEQREAEPEPEYEPRPEPEPEPSRPAVAERALRAEATAAEPLARRPDGPGMRRTPPPTVARPRPAPAWLARWRTIWSENWTGILGTAAVVAGVTFVAINLALRLDALQRFLLVSGAAGGLALPSLLVGGRERWRDLGHWMRSGGAALFLFACTAAGGLPQLGLQWIHRPEPALALLSLGLAVNLAMAADARKQSLAGLHVVLALIPLTICPQTSLTLLLASGVGLIGQLLPGRRPWPLHRLAVTWSTALFHASWFVRNADALRLEPALRDSATLLGLLVFGAAVLLDHRPRLVAERLEPLPLALTLSDWGALAAVLLVYPAQAGSRAIALALAAAAALLLARRVGSGGARWLRRADHLVAQGLAMAAVLSLSPELNHPPLLTLLLLVECVLFLALAVLEGDAPIRAVGWWLTAGSGLALATTGLNDALRRPAWTWEHGHHLQTALELILGALLLSGVAVLLDRRRIPQPHPPLLGWLAGALVFIGGALAPPQAWQPNLSLAAIGGLLLLAGALRPPGLRSGMGAAVLALHGRSWLQLLLAQPWQAQPLLARLLPLLALAVILIAAGGPGWRRWLGIHLLGLDLLLGSYLLVEPVSALMVGVVWLLLSLLSLELADRLRPAEARQVLLVGVLDLLAFTGSYLLVISQSPAYLRLGEFSVRGRLLIELFAIAVALYWWCFNGLRSLRELPLWQRIQPCFLEAWLIGVSVTILSEISTLWRPVAWSLLALALISRPLRRLFAARVQVYAVLVQWVAVGTLVANLSSLSSPSSRWSQQPGAIALLAIALQVGFIVLSHRWLSGADLRAPGGAPLLRWVGRGVAQHPNRWLYYPEFAAVALYLAIRYDHTLLTLLWALEAFVIYGLSAVLRDGQFRYLALAAMGACLLRLVSVDLAQADLGLRGLVFIGVGVLMLGMNTIYTRFWSGPR